MATEEAILPKNKRREELESLMGPMRQIRPMGLMGEYSICSNNL